MAISTPHDTKKCEANDYTHVEFLITKSRAPPINKSYIWH